MFKGNYFDGYKSPLNSNSVFVIILYLINIKPLFVLKHKKTIFTFLKKFYSRKRCNYFIAKHTLIWMNRYF
jgi:alanine dehydrogenase